MVNDLIDLDFSDEGDTSVNDLTDLDFSDEDDDLIDLYVLGCKIRNCMC